MKVTDPRGKVWEVNRVREKEEFIVNLAGGGLVIGPFLILFWLILVGWMTRLPSEGIHHILPWYFPLASVVISLYFRRPGWAAVTAMLALPFGLIQFLVFSAPLWFLAALFFTRSYTIEANAYDEEWDGHVRGYFRSQKVLRQVAEDLEEYGVPEVDPKVFVRVD